MMVAALPPILLSSWTLSATGNCCGEPLVGSPLFLPGAVAGLWYMDMIDI